MKYIASTIVVAALAGSAAAQPTEVLTLDRAIEIAMQQQPSLRQTRAQIDAANARVDLARVALWPTLNLSASLATGSTRPAPCVDDPTRTCGGFFDPSASSGLAAQASWRIFDFGQTRANIRAAKLTAAATAVTIDTTALDVRINVEQAYLEAVARARLVRVAETTVKSEELHLDQARKFVAAQAKDPIEVAQAQARAANAKSALAQAQAAEAIALANLRAAIGWLDASRSPAVQDTWPTPPAAEPDPLNVLVDASRKRRPEIAQVERQIAAAEANVTAASYGNRPVLSATAQTQWDPGSGDWSPEPSWSAGLTLSWQIFDGGRTRAETRIARAGLTGAHAERDALLVNVTTQLAAARSQIIANRANVAASDEAVVAARAQLKLAEARYAQGLGSQIELADAQTAVTTAEGNSVQAQWQLADAWAQLRRALGAP
jgi:outer membrane protein